MDPEVRSLDPHSYSWIRIRGFSVLSILDPRTAANPLPRSQGRLQRRASDTHGARGTRHEARQRRSEALALSDACAAL